MKYLRYFEKLERDIKPNLIKAAEFNNAELIKKLIDSGVDINERNGDTALIYAANFHSIKICILLIDAGADWNIVDESDKDFLDYFKDNKLKKLITDLYPEKYKEYLIKKKSEKYNL